MTDILERLAIGDLGDLKNLGNGVGCVLNVAEEVEVTPPLEYRKIPLKDGSIIPPSQMQEAICWIRDRVGSKKVLVACHYGVGRSASIVIGYLCSLGFGYQEALDFVSSKKPKITPMPKLEETIKESLQGSKEMARCISP
ncbi:MAG: dual specificity protein phosphatase family protein [Thermodesulfobacteriota bacterium]